MQPNARLIRWWYSPTFMIAEHRQRLLDSQAPAAKPILHHSNEEKLAEAFRLFTGKVRRF